ncbi:hypothetical protein [Nocardioides sp. AX2bis]|nr:hypothetical protein [Nocardioides sp. AX2bis]
MTSSPSPLLVLYGVVGMALVVLPLLTSARRHLTTGPDEGQGRRQGRS